MMKEFYETPEMNITMFDTEDVITTSGLDDNELPIVPVGK